jgi:hypothetical protein
MPTIVSSYGASDSNCYCTFVEANSIIVSSSLDYQRWTDAATTTRQIALIRATREIDAGNWYGGKFFFNQSLSFPRATRGAGLWDQYAYGEEGYGWNMGEFPWQYYGANLSQTTVNTFNVEYTLQQEAVKRACAYQAVNLLRLASGGRNRHREKQAQGIVAYSEGIGKLSESFSYGQTSLSLAPEAFDELRKYLGSPTIARG